MSRILDRICGWFAPRPSTLATDTPPTPTGALPCVSDSAPAIYIAPSGQAVLADYDEWVLRIVQCRDPLMWYAGMVGRYVEYCGRWTEGFKSREPSGLINVVRYTDAQLVWVGPDVVNFIRRHGSAPTI